MAFKQGNPGCCPCSGGGSGNSCATYQVKVLDTAGNPVSGLTVSMNRQAGTPTNPAFSPTYAPLTGTTGADGTFSATVPTVAPFWYVTGVTVGMPGNPTQTVANSQSSNVSGVCTFGYTLCIRTRIINTTVAGVSINGNNHTWGVNCPTPGTFPYITVSGADHTYKHYTLTALNSNGTSGSTGTYGSSTGTLGQMPGGFGCLGGYWGGCVGTATVPCGGTATATIQMIPSDGYLYNPAQVCLNDPTDVIQKACCVNFPPESGITGGPFVCSWDTTSWDGRGGDQTDGMTSNGRASMRFTGGSAPSSVVVEISAAIGGAGGISDVRMAVTGNDGTHFASASGAVGSWANGTTHTPGVDIRAGYVATLNGITVSDGPCGMAAPPPLAAPPPGLLTMAGSFVRAASAHIADGLRSAPDGEQARRAAICRACPQHDAVNDSCRVCGCGLALKRSWASSSCPEGRWPAESE